MVTSQQLKEYAEDAKTLSAQLKTRAIAFAAEDTSGSGGYELYERGTQVERAYWGDTCGFTSKRPNCLERETFPVVRF